MAKLKCARKFKLLAAVAGEIGAPILAALLMQSPALAQQHADYVPVAGVAPVYPVRALERGLEGYVILKYTVTAQGTVKDVVVVKSTSKLFNASAVSAARQYRYKPLGVDVPGVRIKINFVEK